MGPAILSFIEVIFSLNVNNTYCYLVSNVERFFLLFGVSIIGDSNVASMTEVICS